MKGARRGSGGADVRDEKGLTFHHFPIPDLSPAENMALLAVLVEDLEALVLSGKVRVSKLFCFCFASENEHPECFLPGRCGVYSHAFVQRFP